jgi:hypothetical protein
VIIDLDFGGHYKREIQWYQQSGERDIPKLYWSDIQQLDSGSIFVMIMENATRRGGRVIDQDEETICIEDSKRMLSHISKLHSKYWHTQKSMSGLGIRVGNNDRLMKDLGFNWVPSVFSYYYHALNAKTDWDNCREKSTWDLWARYNPENLAYLLDLCLNRWIGLDELVRSVDLTDTIFSHSSIKMELEEIRSSKLDVIGEIRNYFVNQEELWPKTIIHGDYRSDNIIISKDELIVIDWQAVSFGCALNDVVQILTHGLSITDLDKHQEELVNFYTKSLNTNLKEPIDEKLIWDLYKASIWPQVIMASYLATHFNKLRLDQGIKIESFGRTFTFLFSFFERAIHQIYLNYIKTFK